MKTYHNILRFCLLGALVVLSTFNVRQAALSAQSDTIRYVKTSDNGGSYQGDGLTWNTAKSNLQDAINDLYQYMLDNPSITSGSVYVAAGTYKPTESTESNGGGLQYTAFKIYPGIHVYGGFSATETDMNADPFTTQEYTKVENEGQANEYTYTYTDYKYRPRNTLSSLEDGGTHTQVGKLQPWNFVNRTILSGSHIGEPTFTYNADKGYYTTLFPSDSYHVVWFATEGFFEIGADKSKAHHGRPLSMPASVDGCSIVGGNASNNTTSERVHAGYGGGAYLVANATLRNCDISKCSATMRGGGVYLDGGGEVDKCFIHQCQTLGVGIMEGFGGGACIDYDGCVTRSYIVNNVGRIGGGVTIYHAQADEYPAAQLRQWYAAHGQPDIDISSYTPYATACIISNNTATAEAGGVYFYEGGVGNHLTVTRNICKGADVTYYGRRHGRSGGVYILNGGQIYNTVIWGNKCKANSDIQYASFTGNSHDEDAANGIEELHPMFYFSAIEKHDISDWAGTKKNNVMSLESANINSITNPTNTYHPYFIGSDGMGKLMGYAGAGLNETLPMGRIDPDYDPENPLSVPNPDSIGIPRPIYWKPAAISSMAKMGLQVSDALHLSSKGVVHAHTDTDMFGDAYEPMSTFGALIRRDEQFGFALVTNQEKQWYADKGYTQSKVNTYNSALAATSADAATFLPVQLPDDGTETTLPTLFVNPSRNAGAAGITIGMQGIGATWDHPVGSINDAIHFFRQHLKKDGSGHIVYDSNGDVEYQFDINGNGTIEPEEKFKHVQILVKGFERGSGINATTAGIDAYLGTQLRTAAVRPCSNMRIYGGYATNATSTATSDRNPRLNPTVVSANITSSGYENNSAHVIALINVRNVIIDGLRIFDGNANLYEHHSYAPIDPVTGEREAITYGGGIILNNQSVPQEQRIDMTGNIFRNGYIANCSAPDGAAVYVNSSNKKGDGTTYSRAELNILNTIIRNNTVGDGTSTITGTGDAGVVTARGGNAKIRLDHCDIVNNCGYALETLVSTDKLHAPTAAYEGQIRIYNSIMYANGKDVIPNRSKQQQALSCRSATGSTDNLDGDYIYLDWDAPKPKNPEHCYATLCRDYNKQTHKWGIRKMDAYQQSLIKSDGKADAYFFDTEAEAQAYIAANPSSGNWTWNKVADPADPSQLIEGPVYLEYPYFDNPARNVGHSPDGDKPMNGGIITYMPGNQNPMTNSAIDESELIWDINGSERNRGGDPDIGAIENTHLPVKDAVIYVTPEGAGRMDGSSWKNAIAGNLVYRVGESYVVDALNADSAGQYITTKNNLYRGGYAVDYVYKTGSTTYVDNQTITQKRTNITYHLDGSVTTEDGGETALSAKTNTQTITESDILTRQPTRFIYGEKSGASRNFYRTNLIDSQIAKASQVAGGYKTIDDSNSLSESNAISITNNREEDYVSGLQFAVEKAASLNKERVKADRVQVWVGNGIYEDYKGYVMRDKVEVLGGFPAKKYDSPGISERQALVSDVIPLSEKNASLADEKGEYETILQVYDKKPFDSDTWTFNTDVILYRDSDFTESGNKTITSTTNIKIPVYYRRDETSAGVYSEYYEVRGGTIIQDKTNIIINPGFEQNVGGSTSGSYVWNNTKAKYGWPDVTGFSLGGTTDGHCARIQNNEDIDFYQDIENLEPGLYRVSVQAFNKGNARNNIKLVANGEERALVSVASSGDGWTDYMNLLASGDYDNNWVDVYVGASGHLRIGLKGSYSGSGKTIFDNFKLEKISGDEVIATATNITKESGYVNKKKKTGYTTLRKPVLSMPDVCLSTWWPGTIYNPNDNKTSDNLSNKRRQVINGKIVTPLSGSGYVKYEDVHWDGFTIRNGFCYDYFANRDGGGGVRMFEGGTLENCVITDNTVSWTVRGRGAGGYCDGVTSEIIGCFFVNNLNSGIRNATPSKSNDKDNNGGGIYMLVGTCYNSLFANNVCWGKDARGAGIYIEQATFYNNTSAYNTCRNRDKTIYTSKGSGVHQYEGANGGAVLNVFNTIFYGNTGLAIGAQDNSKITGFKNCYIQSETGINSTIVNKMVDCTIYNNKNTTQAPNPFERGTSAPDENNFRLLGSSLCVNGGLIPADFVGDFPDRDVDFADRIQDCRIDIGAYEYDGTLDIHPDYELIAFDPEKPNDRELCAVYYVADAGRGLGTASAPEEAACPEKLQKVLDAAGRLKADIALFKAGKYIEDSGNKYGIYSNSNIVFNNPITPKYEYIALDGGGDSKLAHRVNYTATDSLSHVKHVVVKVTEGYYYPVRSSNNNMVSGDLEEVLPTRVIAIPHGVEIWGGYTNDEHAFYETYRDPLNHPTVFQGQVTNENTGETGRTYHVVSFTDNIYDNDELPVAAKTVSGTEYSGTDGFKQLADLGAAVTDRSVIDGVIIESGYANGIDEDGDRSGGAAVVTDFAHVRNCVIQRNEAMNSGGGLYLKPAALVSGCILLGNSSEFGGGLYVEEPESVSNDTYARVYNSTIVYNSASVRGGGVWYEQNIRAKGLAIWHNTSNDMNNVSGLFDTGAMLLEDNYPFAFTAVQSRRLPGVNNIELKTENRDDIRWISDPAESDMRWRGDSVYYSGGAYYYMEKLSVLVRAGMPYASYKALRSTYPSLELRDIAGVARMREYYNEEQITAPKIGPDSLPMINYLKHMTLVPEAKDNDFVEIGARVRNNEMMLNFNRPFTRLFVAMPVDVDMDVANTMMNSGDSLYSQQGSSMAYPFQRLDDALDYIVKLRSSTQTTNNHQTLRDIYRDTRFEIFVAGGTYYPSHNARGVDDSHARASTFVLPEGVSLVGGLNPRTYYCQAGYNFDFLQPMAGDDILSQRTINDIFPASGDPLYDTKERNARVAIYDAAGNDITESLGVELISKRTQQIWNDREPYDINGNNIYEPWEFLYKTTLSGNTPRGMGNQDNVYHVITCYADSLHLGALPRRFCGYEANGIGSLQPHIKFQLDSLLDSRSSGMTDGNNPAITNKESVASQYHRTIIINGVEVTNGNARDYDGEAINNRQNFWRGGGILVDGNWETGEYDSGYEYDLDNEGNYKYNDETDPQHSSPLAKPMDGYPLDPDAIGLRNIPLIISNSQFIDNNAIQGGAIFSNGDMHIFNSSFVENFAEGPNNSKDNGQTSIHYNGGGAVATNALLRCCNTIFANNEAMLGNWSNKMSSDAKGWLKQGFGGAIWGGTNSNVRVMNCDIVMNKGVSYPAVYVDHDDGTNKFAVNTIFWGNRAAGWEDKSETWANGWEALQPAEGVYHKTEGDGIMDVNRDVFNFRTAYEAVLDARATDNGIESLTPQEQSELIDSREQQIMFFCCYRKGFGPQPEMSSGETRPAMLAEHPEYKGKIFVAGHYFDVHEVPFLGENTSYYNIFGGNNNINVTFANEGAGGPNFVLPSVSPGKDGYMPSANWMISRINDLVDNGWSYLTLIDNNGTTEFKGNSVWLSAPDNSIGGGPYNAYSYNLRTEYNLPFMPLGDETYMKYTSGGGSESDMLRISSNPMLLKPEEKAYIDLGVYEYQHRSLRINQTGEADILWVAETEDVTKGNDGYTWDTPTSNLQAAIETLLRCRNDHAKQINIIEGEYRPNALLGDGDDMSLSFTIQTKLMNNGALTPPHTGTDIKYGVKSLTIRGGYDNTIPGEEGYNHEKNQVLFSMAKRTSISDDQLGHLVNILDAEQYETSIAKGATTPDNKETGVAIPITFEGITFVNEYAPEGGKGAAICYHEQTQYVEGHDDVPGGKGSDLLEPPAAQNGIVPPKLTIRNCIFRSNGVNDQTNPLEPASAVKIEGGGGEALVVNSLFDHNEGTPLDAVNTTVLNCTFGLNQGHLTLTEQDESSNEYHSALHNSVIWMDDQKHDGLTPWSIKDKTGTELPFFRDPDDGITSERITYNSYTIKDIDPSDIDNDPDGEPDARNNMLLREDRGTTTGYNDMFFGPNFVDPYNGDFHLLPGKQLVNKGNNDQYASIVWSDYYDPSDPDNKDICNGLMMNLHSDQNTYIHVTVKILNDEGEYEDRDVEILKAHKDYELGGKGRLQSTAIDRGAYECLGSGLRIIYVNPNNAATTGEETGRDWEHAFGPGQLQLAIDAAAIYHVNSEAGKHAYVMVKGSENSQGRIIIREGVDIFGGIPNNEHMQAVPIDNDPDLIDWEYTDAEVNAFVNRVRAERPGLAARTTVPTAIKGVQTVGVMSHSDNALIDGFKVSNEATESAPATKPAVDIIVRNVTMRNCIVADNLTADGVPVVNIAGRSGGHDNDGASLLYNTLVYGNKAGTTTAGTIVNVGANGYVLNCTVVADNQNETPIGGTNGSNSTHVKNNIAVNEYSGRGSMFAPYLRPTDHVNTPADNSGTPVDVLTSHRPYWYQLIETSDLIDAGQDNGITPVTGGNEIARDFPYVNFDLDRDLLGNPRRLSGYTAAALPHGKVDMGCFETWRITGNRLVDNRTNSKAAADLEKYVTDLEVPSIDDPDYATKMTDYENLLATGRVIAKNEFWTDDYGGNHYPHTGSVVYVMNDANLVFRTSEGTPVFTSTNPVRPGYVLVKSGGSVYGQGNAMEFNYVAAEKVFASGTQYGLISLPFDSYLRATASASGSDYTALASAVRFGAYRYDSDGRSAYNYEFQSENSSLWQPLDNTLRRNASDGWLMKFTSPLVATDTLRFTGWGNSTNDFIYEEVAGATEKVVTLVQNDNRPGDGTAHFTREEDMGWNIAGSPYLVSTFRTQDFYDGRYNMQIPHILYKMNTDGEYLRNSTAYVVQSWDNDAELLALHEGFFLQTAAINDYEDLHFRLPVYSGSAPILASPRPMVMLRNSSYEGDIMQVKPDEDADKHLTYTLGRDGVKWLLRDVPQLYMLSDKLDSRISLAGAAPVETDLQLGVSIPEPKYTDDADFSALNAQQFTFSLPEKEAYSDYEYVWLIDRSRNNIVNLMQGDYTTTINSGEDNSRFQLRFGGLPIIDADGKRDYIIYAYDSRLYIRGLMAGDHISVYTITGKLILSTTATDSELVRELPQQNQGYVVRVNDKSKKVMNL